MSKVLMEISARHVHLSQQDVETLFGKGAELHVRKMLSQPGQFACNERVELVGPKGSMKNVSVLGPARKASQVEISLTDARAIGLEIPVRESGVLEGSPGCTLIGPAGSVELKEGVIAAKRHIHTTPEDAAKMGLADRQIVQVRIEGTGRAGVFGDVVVRVDPTYATAMHIDTDEANAFGIAGEVHGEVLK